MLTCISTSNASQNTSVPGSVHFKNRDAKTFPKVETLILINVDHSKQVKA